MINFFVDPLGSDDNPGTKEKPFRSIAKGISMLRPGRSLNLRQGNYLGPVTIRNLKGLEEFPIVIRSHNGEHATIDGCLPQFNKTDNKDVWERAFLHDSSAHPDEFVSSEFIPMTSPHDRVNRGAFVDQEPYTRLITYSRLEDLRANNQTFGVLEEGDSRPGVDETDENGKKTGNRFPFVYMGPGIFFNIDENKQRGKVHIRLSRTSNNVPGIEDYTGETDPAKLRLAISHTDTTTLLVQNSSFIRFENLTIRFGGEDTLILKRTDNVVFDHVRLLAASHGVRMGANTRLLFSHCEMCGGIPSWYFRSDRKAAYYFKVGDVVVHNELGNKTSLTLLFGHTNDGVEMHNCEFLNAHDLSMPGKNVRFHHNWINNLNDEGLIINGTATDNIDICQNVVTKCLSAVSFAGPQVSGETHIYRNLIDLREPTAGTRPKKPNDPDVLQYVFRFGQLYKSGGDDGTLDLFQNTFLVARQDIQASYHHYRNSIGSHRRRSFNNIFIAINDSSSDIAISFVPFPTFQGDTDGNCYFRIGRQTAPLLRHLEYFIGKEKFEKHEFYNLDQLRGNISSNPPITPSVIFKHSKQQYEPGYEKVSIQDNPMFHHLAVDGALSVNDDFRLQVKSPARGKGIVLPKDLRTLDTLAPIPPRRPDIGCYAFNELGLRVGVDYRRRFPTSQSDVRGDMHKKD